MEDVDRQVEKTFKRIQSFFPLPVPKIIREKEKKRKKKRMKPADLQAKVI